MNLVLSMWSVWGLLVLVYLSLRIYIARLNRDEDDTIILDDAAFGQEKAEQAAILAKVHKIEPAQRAALIALGAMTLIVIVYYIIDAMHQF